ncbi:NAD(P)-dependent oxidoreductase [Krasilnikovia cinnamomea]|nr:NAD(P)-dependent oxidoreductase [Krasilnikovia cinnamomea]
MLTASLGTSVELVPWHAGSLDGAALILAPHEWSSGERRAALSAADWSWVHLTSAGVDFIDDAAWPTDRLLTRSWQCYAAPVAEYAVHAVLSHEWGDTPPWTAPETRPPADPNRPPVPASVSAGRPRGMWGCTVGVAGWGEVGRRIGRTLAGFGAEIRVLRRSRTAVGRAEPGIEFTTDLDRLLDCEHLVIALPLTPRTHRMFDAAALSRARPGLHLVNVSRAELIDQDGLAELCARGDLAATLDVTDPEPLPPTHPLRTIPSVRLSPHVAWRSRLSDVAFVADFVAVWRALAGGGPVPGVVGAGAADRARHMVVTNTKVGSLG